VVDALIEWVHIADLDFSNAGVAILWTEQRPSGHMEASSVIARQQADEALPFSIGEVASR
jgi:hypothetical protein